VSRAVALLALAVVFGGLGLDDVWAHAGLRTANPAPGATLGDSPKVLQLSFWEKPELSLSVVRVHDTAGRAYQLGPPEAVPGAPLTLSVGVKPLERGVYTVSWRIISGVDGHATTGTYAFGVRVTPTLAAAAATTYPEASPFDVLARWILIVGLVALLGAAAAAVARFGGASDVMLGASGWALALLGLAMLAAAQRRNAEVSFGALLGTSIGRGLLWRAVAIAVAGIALLGARFTPALRRGAMAAAALASMVTMAIHVAGGHAAAGDSMPAMAAQWAHFVAAGIWLGGLAALLLGVRGVPSAEKAAAVRRFSRIAAAGLLIVVVSGALRTLDELSAWNELLTTGYGRAVLAKIAFGLAIAAFGAFNRWRSVPAAAVNLRPLRRSGTGELALTAGALAAAALLGTLPPPASGLAAPREINVSGSDFGTTVRVSLSAASDQPGPNRFVVEAVDYDSKKPLQAKRVSLRFTPLDDPGVTTTSLLLAPGPGASYSGSGANLAFDGRWRVTVVIERAASSVQVPLEVETHSAPPLMSIERIPGQAPKYTAQLASGDFVRISPDPERAGRSQVYLSFFDMLMEPRPLESAVLTAAASGPARPQALRRLEASRFVADVELEPGRNTITVIGRAADGSRLRAPFEIDVPSR
jgi:copper transport protein